MSVPTSRLAYQDVYDVFDKALNDEHGIRIPFPSRGKAAYYRMRMYAAREIAREDNKKVYEEGHPMYGRSNYDAFSATLREVKGIWYIYLIPMLDARRMEIESLEGLDNDQPQVVEPSFRR